MTTLIQEIYNQPYFEIDGRQLRYDLFKPMDVDNAPLIIFIHGGGWIEGDKSGYYDEAAWLSRQGYVCACVEYRLAPEYKYPAQILDIQRFIQFAHQNHQSLKIDPHKIVLFGNSAGGYLALMAGMLDKLADKQSLSKFDPSSLKVNSIISLCPITSLELAYDRKYIDTWYIYMNAISNIPYDRNDYQWLNFSPINNITTSAPYIFLAHGNKDSLVPCDQSIKLHQSLLKNYLDSELHLIEDGEHCFTYEQWENIRKLYMQFLNRVLN